MKVLLDVNVLADLFLKREEWLTDAVAIWEANRTGRIQCCALASNIDTLAYLVKRNRAEDPLGGVWSLPCRGDHGHRTRDAAVTVSTIRDPIRSPLRQSPSPPLSALPTLKRLPTATSLLQAIKCLVFLGRPR